MNTLHYLTVHAFAYWLLVLTRINYDNLRIANPNIRLKVWIVAHVSERGCFDSIDLHNKIYNADFTIIYDKTDLPYKEWHGIFLDKGIAKIREHFVEGDSIIISDSDMVFDVNKLETTKGNFEMLYWEKRPMAFNIKNYNFLPHPCFLYFSPYLSNALIELSKSLSFMRNRSFILGQDLKNADYGADSCDYFVWNLIQHCEPKLSQAEGMFFHFSGCTEVMRKIKLWSSTGKNYSASDLIEYVSALDDGSYHDDNKTYYINGLINNIVILQSNNYINYSLPELGNYEQLKDYFRKNDYYHFLIQQCGNIFRHK